MAHEVRMDCRLRRVDHALHETTQRFVESLFSGEFTPKLTQFADLAFACKKLTQDTWYWLDPLTSRARVGYLVFLPRQPIVWIDEQFRQAYRIPMRVSSSVYEKKSVFVASLDTDGELRLEDCILFAGDHLRVPFSKRWEKVKDFYGTFYREDQYLQQGLRVTIAKYTPLTQALSWENVPTLMFAQGERAGRKLRIQCPGAAHAPATVTTGSAPTKPVKKEDARHSGKPKATPLTQVCAIVHDNDTEETTSVETVETTSDKEGVRNARAVAHEEFPDTYTIWMGAVKKGFGAVQDLELSQTLRAKGKELQVRVKWNEEFNMWEILSLV